MDVATGCRSYKITGSDLQLSSILTQGSQGYSTEDRQTDGWMDSPSRAREQILQLSLFHSIFYV